MSNTHRRCDSTRQPTQPSQVATIVHNGLNMLRIYPVAFAAELETGSRLPTGEYIHTARHNSTRLNMFNFNFSTKSVGSHCELIANSIHTANATVESRRRRRCVSGLTHVYWYLQRVSVNRTNNSCRRQRAKQSRIKHTKLTN